MSSWDAVTTQLAAMEANITGVTKAYAFDAIPDALASAALPAFTNIPGEAQYFTAEEANQLWGVGVATELRAYEAWVWYKPVQRPPDAWRHASGLQDLHNAAKAYLLARPQLEGLQYVLKARLVADTGPIVTEYVTGSGNNYSACGFTIEVAYMLKVTYAGGD
jgi:hypothetical protein